MSDKRKYRATRELCIIPMGETVEQQIAELRRSVIMDATAVAVPGKYITEIKEEVTEERIIKITVDMTEI